MARTLYVYPADGTWVLRKEGQKLTTFRTQREAVESARQSGKKTKPAQVVVFNSKGRVSAHVNYGLPRIQEPPRRGRLGSKRIADAVARVTLDRLKAPGEQAS